MVPADGLLCLAFQIPPLHQAVLPPPPALGVSRGKGGYLPPPLALSPDHRTLEAAGPGGQWGGWREGEGQGNRDSEEEPELKGKHRQKAAGWPGTDIKQLYFESSGL